MDESEFEKRSGATLSKLEDALRAVDDDLEVDLGGGILTVEFPDGTKFVINAHGVAKEIWLSANLSASHYAWDGTSWRDRRNGNELFAEVGRAVSEKMAEPVVLRS